MAIEYLKKAAKTPATESGEARKVVDEMLATIARDGEAAVREYAKKLDDWSGEIVVSADEIERRTRDIDAERQARHRVRDRAGAALRAGAARVDARVLARGASRV